MAQHHLWWRAFGFRKGSIGKRHKDASARSFRRNRPGRKGNQKANIHKCQHQPITQARSNPVVGRVQGLLCLGLQWDVGSRQGTGRTKVAYKAREETNKADSKVQFHRTTRYVEWIDNIVPVIKKNGILRVCIDFVDLNAATRKDEYPMPVAKILVDSSARNEYLSMLDGYYGYNQIFIADKDMPKTTFRCPGALGTYEWVVMPFGLKNDGATYQREMNSIFHDFIETFMQIYIDDIVVNSVSGRSHIDHFWQSFERMRRHGLKMNPLKCAFCV